MTHHQTNTNRFAKAYADTIVRAPGLILCILLALGVVAAWGTAHLRINSNQLDLISQDLPEVKEVKRIIDMVGGSGYLMFALRSNDAATMKLVADDLAARLRADTQHVRFVTYRVPIDFMQEKMVLFVETADLRDAKARVNQYLREKIRRSNPFYLELRDTPQEPTLDLRDLFKKYSHVGKKTVLDDYYISEDQQMLLLLIKPMWDTNELGKTKAYIDMLNEDLARYSRNNAHHVTLVEDYHMVGGEQGHAHTMAYGYTGAYKSALDDSYAIAESLEPVSMLAFFAILGITVLFFRKWLPSLIVISGMILGTVMTMGFAYITVGTLNMITSILGGILMGFGVDYGIHFIFRTRIELGLGKPAAIAIRDAILNAGRPALIAAIVTGGSFMVLLVSEFRGFSQFGFLAGCGTLIIGFTMFSWSAAVLALLAKYSDDLPRKLIGTMPMQHDHAMDGRIPRPRLLLTLSCIAVLFVCAFAIPWSSTDIPIGEATTLRQKLLAGVRFNYNTRALIPEDQHSVQLQDEINQRFNISSDPIAVYSKDLQGAKKVFDEFHAHPEKYQSVDQIVSIYTFVPPPWAAENAKILEVWRGELDAMGFNENMLPDHMQHKWPLIHQALHAKPYTVQEVPEIYANQFYNLPTAKPENHGILTFIYPRIDLSDGKKMLQFSDETSSIHTDSGEIFHGAGLAILYAKLARIVLFDGKMTVFLTTLWILIMHFLDFRSILLALASVIPLGVGLVMMLGLMALTSHPLNFMNIIILPILLGFGVSHGLYLLHRFLEGTTPMVAFRSVGAAVASSTLTAIAGFASLFAAGHNGVKSMGYVACLGLSTTLLVSFTVLAAVLQLIDDRRIKPAGHTAESAHKSPRNGNHLPQ